METSVLSRPPIFRLTLPWYSVASGFGLLVADKTGTISSMSERAGIVRQFFGVVASVMVIIVPHGFTMRSRLAKASSILSTITPGSLMLLSLLADALGSAQSESFLYPIRESSKWGFINRSGAVVVAPTYDAVGDVHEDRIRVNVGSHAGYIDLSA